MTGTSTTTPAPVLWDELSWGEIAELVAGGMDMAVLPVGATEQHGPHLPLGMDTMAAQAVARGASARTGVPVLPSVPVGCSLGHTTRWPGTLSLRPGTLARVITDMAAWLHAAGVRRLVMLNGHVTNHAPLRCALEEIRHDIPGMRVALRSLWDLSPEIHALYHDDAHNFHANRAETSLMLAARPDLVRMELAVDEPDLAADLVFAYPVDHETPSGVVGRARDATPEEGHRLLGMCVDALERLLRSALDEEPPLTPKEDR